MRRFLVGVPLALAVLTLGTAPAAACGWSCCGCGGYSYYAAPAYGYYAAPAYSYYAPRAYGYYAPPVYYAAPAYSYYAPRAYMHVSMRRLRSTATAITDPMARPILGAYPYGYAGRRRW